ncbi:MAG TPA: cytochrome c [Tianweitania sediminis]|jgi:mono/diheme cytochrome c family protein|nr:cytochrome c [Tianweitania sediminis]
MFLLCSFASDVSIAEGTSAEQRGREIALANCSRCHSVEAVGASTLPEAPPFRLLHRRYPVEQLEESLAEGIGTGHPEMPEFRFEPAQISDFLAYLRSLASRRP